MKGRICASSPHHVTALFKPHIESNASLTGSIGVGLVVEPRVKACTPGTLSLATSHISTLRRVGELLGDVNASLDLNLTLPVGVGFAVSAASAIASSLALGLSRGLSYLKSLKVAHEAEVLESTGLGDVLAISCGIGMAVRLRPGAPGVGLVDCKQLPPGVSILALAVRSEHTRELIKYYVEKGLHEKAAPLIERIGDSMSFEMFSELVLKFNVDNGILRHLLGERGEEVILKTPGLITAYGKKGVVIVIVEGDTLQDSINHLNSLGYKIYYLEPSRGGPEVWTV